MVLLLVDGVPMPGDMTKCCYFCVFLDIAGVLKDAPSQKHQKFMYHVMCDWKMVLVFVGGAPMSSNMAKCTIFCVFLDIAEVSLSQKYHKCMYPIMRDWKMVLMLVGEVQMFPFYSY